MGFNKRRLQDQQREAAEKKPQPGAQSPFQGKPRFISK
jgi:hypothetical protein